jgi:acetyl-CoA carboxylase biotin carboxyl carrier protein
MKLSEIQDLIKFVAKSGVSEVELETKDIKIQIKAQGAYRVAEQVAMIAPAAAPVQQVAVAAAPQQVVVTTPETPTATDESHYITIKSPMIGTFYRSPAPDKPAFVSVGDEITPGKVLCIIEAMKLFNEVESEIKGKIVKVLIDDLRPIEYDQPLFLVDPS